MAFCNYVFKSGCLSIYLFDKKFKILEIDLVMSMINLTIP